MMNPPGQPSASLQQQQDTITSRPRYSHFAQV